MLLSQCSPSYLSLGPRDNTFSTQKESENQADNCLNLEKFQCCEKLNTRSGRFLRFFQMCVVRDNPYGAQKGRDHRTHIRSHDIQRKFPRCGNFEFSMRTSHLPRSHVWRIPASLVFLGLPSGQRGEAATVCPPNSNGPTRLLLSGHVMLLPSHYQH